MNGIFIFFFFFCNSSSSSISSLGTHIFEKKSIRNCDFHYERRELRCGLIVVVHTYYRMQFIIIKRIIIIYRYCAYNSAVYICIHHVHISLRTRVIQYNTLFTYVHKIWALCANVRIVFAPKRFPRAGTSALKRECEKSV